MRKILCAALTAALLIPLADAEARKPSLCERAYGARMSVIHRFGHRAPGRNICRKGVVVHSSLREYRIAIAHGFTARPATVNEKYLYLQRLRALLRPPRAFMTTVAIQPGRDPSMTLSPGLAPTGTAACIVAAESHGDPHATNPNGHYGIAQWALGTWKSQGGIAMTGQADPRNATYQQQLAVLSHALATYGDGAWRPYDGC